MKAFRVTTSSHGFKVDKVADSRAHEALKQYLLGLRHFGLVRAGRSFIRKPLKTFASSNITRSYYRFHIAEKQSFLNHMSEYGFNDSSIEWSENKPYQPRIVELPAKEKWAPRENQLNPIDYIADETNGPWGKLLPAMTGSGKGAMTMFALSRRNVLPILLVRPMYMDKWMLEVRDFFDIPEDSIISIQGSGELKKMIELQAAGKLTARFIIISNKTYQSWISSFEKTKESQFRKTWKCTPENFFEFMRAGFRVMDEVHQDFHLNFKIDTYTHVNDSISLSATLMTKDPFLRSRYELAYPHAKRCEVGPLNKYIDSSAYLYQFREPERIRTTEYGSTTYSHLAFEESILKNPVLTENYFDMIAGLVEIDFVRIKDEGEKFVVFCARIQMCRALCKYLKQRFSQYDIRTYVGSEDGGPKDPYENLIEPVGRITTYGSAGTAQDVPMLRTNIMTISMDSLAGNIQVLGRTRVMKNGNTPRFVYTVAENIPKHMLHHKGREEILKQRARSYRVRFHDKPI